MLSIAKLGVPEFSILLKIQNTISTEISGVLNFMEGPVFVNRNLNPSICPDCERATLIGFYTCAICSSFGAGLPAQPWCRVMASPTGP